MIPPLDLTLTSTFPCGRMQSSQKKTDLTEQYVKGELSFDDACHIVKNQEIVYAQNAAMQAMFSDRKGRVLIIEPGIGHRFEQKRYSLITNYSILNPVTQARKSHCLFDFNVVITNLYKMDREKALDLIKKLRDNFTASAKFIDEYAV